MLKHCKQEYLTSPNSTSITLSDNQILTESNSLQNMLECYSTISLNTRSNKSLTIVYFLGLYISFTLSWKWQCNGIVKTWQNGFVIKFPKKVWHRTTFLILSYLNHVTEVCCIPRTCDCWYLIFLYNFAIFAMHSIANIVFTNSFR